MSVFTPNLYVHRVTEITKELLDENGIKGIVLDVDNTLTLHGSQTVRKEVLDWLKKMRDSDIKLTLASNNSRKRIDPFAKRLELDYIAMSCKPMTFAFTRACSKFGLHRSEVAVVGDQIYTDIVGGNVKGLFTILVDPFTIEDGAFFHLKRRLERIHIDHYHKHSTKK